jgi:predicted secreted Zn-dependent protease
MIVYDDTHDADLDVKWMNHRAATYGLSHEQRHFDITEVYARKIRKMFREQITRSNVEQVDDMLQTYFAQWESFQDQYDLETQHALDTAKQEQWNKKIQQLLNSLSEYDKADGTVTLKR